MKAKLSITRIANWICLLLIAAMIAVTFLPCWTYETEERVEINGEKEKITVTKDVSISEYVWFPREHEDLTEEHFETLYEDDEDFFINDMITAPAVLLVLGIALGILSLWHQGLPVASALAVVLSSWTAISYNVRPEYALGVSFGTVTLVSYIACGISVVLLALSVLELVLLKLKKAKAA